MGEAYSDEFDAWKDKGACFPLHKPRRLALGPANAQAGAANTDCAVINIGPPYFGDTPQQTLYFQSLAVELIGKIENGVCNENRQLYQQYSKAYQEWTFARTGLCRPTVKDIANLTNVTQFPKRS